MLLPLALSLLPAVAMAQSGIPGLVGVDNLIVFGDSYTDEGRLDWFFSHDGQPPAPGTHVPTSNQTAGGTNSWPFYTSGILSSTTYNYAVSGATCSNKLISRYLEPIDAPFPSVLEYGVPAFQADVDFADDHGDSSFFPNRLANNSLYALWIGTNDLGTNAYLTDSQKQGTTISEFIGCIWNVFDAIYDYGGRHFVLFTQAPLERSPLYAAPENSGVLDTGYWANKTSYNMTEYEQKILEYSTNINTIFAYGVPFQLLVRSRWPNATFSVLDTHQIILDITKDPESYLDSPANVTGFYTSQCGGECENATNPLTSYLW